MKRANMLQGKGTTNSDLSKDARFWMVMISLIILGLLMTQGVGK